MRSRFSYAILLAATLIQGCARASHPVELGEHTLSSCVFDRSHSPGPERGNDWDACEDNVTFTARITEDTKAGDGSVFMIHVSEKDDGDVAAFQKRNLHSFSALRTGKKVLTLVAIFGAYSSPLGLRLDPEEARAFRAALE